MDVNNLLYCKSLLKLCFLHTIYNIINALNQVSNALGHKLGSSKFKLYIKYLEFIFVYYKIVHYIDVR